MSVYSNPSPVSSGKVDRVCFVRVSYKNKITLSTRVRAVKVLDFGEKQVNLALNRLIPISDELLEMEVPYLGVVSAGFPSEAYNYMEEGIDLLRCACLGASTYCQIALRCPHGARLLLHARLRILATKPYEISGLTCKT